MPTVTVISHDHINPEALKLAITNAELDPDGQFYPWQGQYPLVGQTVYCCIGGIGYLVVITDRERGAGAGLDQLDDLTVYQVFSGAMPAVRLCLTRGELRPVAWTAEDEVRLWERAQTQDM